jgi:hypothetical protein
MTEHILKTHVAPPEGWEYQGEFRPVKFGEWYLQFGKALNWSSQTPSENCFPILRRARWVPKPGERYWMAYGCGHVYMYADGRSLDMRAKEEFNRWQTPKQAIAYSKARRALAERMHAENARP